MVMPGLTGTQARIIATRALRFLEQPFGTSHLYTTGVYEGRGNAGQVVRRRISSVDQLQRKLDLARTAGSFADLAETRAIHDICREPHGDDVEEVK